ncbi:TPA: hypothetical protein ACGO8N_000200 [Streptococcus suis]
MSRPDRYPYSQDQWVIEKTRTFSIVNEKYGTHTKVTMYRNLLTGKIKHDWIEWRTGFND